MNYYNLQKERIKGSDGGRQRHINKKICSNLLLIFNLKFTYLIIM